METAVKEKRKMSTRWKTNILSDKVLTDFMTNRNRKSLKDLRGKIEFKDDYDYKLMRN